MRTRTHLTRISGLVRNSPGIGAYLAQLVTDWLQLDGRLISLAISYRGIDRPGQPLRCRGVVKRIEARTVELEIWSENPEGITTATGTAIVEFD